MQLLALKLAFIGGGKLEIDTRTFSLGSVTLLDSVLWARFGCFLTWSTIQPVPLIVQKRELPVTRGVGIYFESTDVIAVIQVVRIQDASLVTTPGRGRMATQEGLLTWTWV